MITRLKHKARAMEIRRGIKSNLSNISQSNDSLSVSIPLLGSIAAGNPKPIVPSPALVINVPGS